MRALRKRPSPEDLRSDLRAAWARGLRVRVSLSATCKPRQVTGAIDDMAASGAWVSIRGIHIPVDEIERLRVL